MFRLLPYKHFHCRWFLSLWYLFDRYWSSFQRFRILYRRSRKFLLGRCLLVRLSGHWTILVDSGWIPCQTFVRSCKLDSHTGWDLFQYPLLQACRSRWPWWANFRSRQFHVRVLFRSSQPDWAMSYHHLQRRYYSYRQHMSLCCGI